MYGNYYRNNNNNTAHAYGAFSLSPWGLKQQRSWRPCWCTFQKNIFKILLSRYTNMAAMTSHANAPYCTNILLFYISGDNAEPCTSTATTATHPTAIITRKRFRPTPSELEILKCDHEQDYRSTSAERAIQFGVSEKQVLDWHKRFKSK